MKVFYKKLFEPIQVFEIEDKKSLKNTLESKIEKNELNNCEKYKIIKENFKELKSLEDYYDSDEGHDLFFQLTPHNEKRGLIGAGKIFAGVVIAGISSVFGFGPGILFGGGLAWNGVKDLYRLHQEGKRDRDFTELNDRKPNVQDQIRRQNILRQYYRNLEKQKPAKLDSKSLNPTLVDNRVSPNSVIPEVLGKFRFRPYQLTSLSREGGRVTVNYDSVYSGGEGEIELKEPYYGDSPAASTKYTTSSFNYTSGSFTSDFDDFYRGVESSTGRDIWTAGDRHHSFFTNPSASETIFKARDTSGLKLRGAFIPSQSIVFDFIFNTKNSANSLIKSWKDLWWKKPKRYIIGSTLTVGSYSENNNDFLGFNNSVLKGSLPGSPSNGIIQLTRQIVDGSDDIYKINYTGSKTLSSISFIYDFLKDFSSYTIDNDAFSGPTIRADEISTGVYRFNLSASEGEVIPSIDQRITKIETNTTSFTIESNTSGFFDNWSEVYVDNTTYYPGTPIVSNNIYTIRLYTDNARTIPATSAFDDNAFIFNIKLNDNTSLLWNGIYGNPSGYTSNSDFNNVLKLVIGKNLGCEFLNNYDGKRIYYKRIDDSKNVYENQDACNIKTLRYVSQGSQRDDPTITMDDAIKPFRLLELSPPLDDDSLPLDTQSVNYTTLPTASVTGKPERFTDSSDISSVLYMLTGRLLGDTNCPYLRTYNDKIYYKQSSLGTQTSFQSETVCGFTSSASNIEPIITSFTAEASGVDASSYITVSKGTQVTLRWSIVGDPDPTFHVREKGFNTNLATNGNSLILTVNSSKTYVVTATNSLGTSSSEVIVIINDSARINSFTAEASNVAASPNISVASGTSVTLKWNLSGNPDPTFHVREPDSQTDLATSGSSLVVTPTATKTYILTAMNSQGTVTSDVTITIIATPLPATHTKVTSFTGESTGVSASSIISVLPRRPVTLRWTITGTPTPTFHIRASGSQTNLTTSGTSFNITPTRTTTYILTATNALRTVIAHVVVILYQRPTIHSFTGETSAFSARSSLIIYSGTQFTLRWLISANPSFTFYLRESGQQTNLATTGTSHSITLTSPTILRKTYVLRATNSVGSVSSNVLVTIIPRGNTSSLTKTQFEALSITGFNGNWINNANGAASTSTGTGARAYSGSRFYGRPHMYYRNSDGFSIAPYRGGSLNNSENSAATNIAMVYGAKLSCLTSTYQKVLYKIERRAFELRYQDLRSETVCGITSQGYLSNLYTEPEYDVDRVTDLIAWDTTENKPKHFRVKQSLNRFSVFTRTVDAYEDVTATSDIRSDLGYYVRRENDPVVPEIPSTGTDQALTVPSIISFTAEAAGVDASSTITVNSGDEVTLRWRVTGNPPPLFNIRESGSNTDLATTGTSLTVSPTATKTYVLTATNSQGTVTRNVTVNIIIPPDIAPVITSFTGEANGVSAGSSINVTSGASVILRWGINGRPTPTFHVRESGSNTDLATTGTSLTVSPTATKTYILTATNAADTITANVVVNVVSTSTIPSITSFTGEATGVNASSSISVNSGTSVTLRWAITGTPTPTFHVRVSGSNTNLATTGTSHSVSPTSTTTYILTATNLAGTVTANVVINILDSTIAPSITSFTGEANGVDANSTILVYSWTTVTLRWAITGTPTPTFHVRVSGSNTNLATTGTSLTVSPTSTTNYILTATNSASSITRNVIVVILPLPNHITYTTLTATGSYPSDSRHQVIGDKDEGIILFRDSAVRYVRSGNNMTYTRLTSTGSYPSDNRHKVIGDKDEGIILFRDSAFRYVRSGNNMTYTRLTSTGSYTYRRDSKILGDGYDGCIFLNNFAIRYVRSGNNITFTRLTATGSLTYRQWFGAVGDKDEGIIFGGYEGTGTLHRLNDAVRYVRSSNTITYTTLTATGSYTARNSFQAVGDEDKGIIFGGIGGRTTYFNDAIRYVRSSNAITYTTLTSTTSYSARYGYQAVGDENEGIIFGGYDVRDNRLNDAVRYVTSSSITTIPVISSFTGEASDVSAGDAITVPSGTSVKLKWAISGNPTPNFIVRTLGSITNIATTGTSVSVAPTQTTTYVLTAVNSQGTATKNVVVTIAPKPVTIAPVITSFTGEANGVSASNSINITSGTSVTLKWGMTGTPTPTFHVRESGSNTDLATRGTSLTVSPTATKTYVLTATNSADTVTANVVVNVVSSSTIPSIRSFTGESTGVSVGSSISVSPGASVTLRWTIAGTPIPTFHLRESGSNTNLATTGTSHSVSPTSTTTYVLTATNSQGTVTANVVVNVSAAPPTNVAPVITSFHIYTTGGVNLGANTSVTSGTTVSLRWAITGTPTPTFHVRVMGTQTDLATTGTSVNVTPTGTTTYVLTATNAAGTVNSSVVVTVTIDPNRSTLTKTQFEALSLSGFTTKWINNTGQANNSAGSGRQGYSTLWGRPAGYYGSHPGNGRNVFMLYGAMLSCPTATYNKVYYKLETSAYGGVSHTNARETICGYASSNWTSGFAQDRVTDLVAWDGTANRPKHFKIKDSITVASSQTTTTANAYEDITAISPIRSQLGYSGSGSTITSFTGESTGVNAGSSIGVSSGAAVTLRWAITGNPTPTFHVRVSGSQTDLATTGTSIVVNPTASTTTYILTAINSIKTVTANVVVHIGNYVTITPSSTNFPPEGWGTKGWGRRVSNGNTFFGAINNASALDSNIVGFTNSYLVTKRGTRFNAVEYKGTIYPLSTSYTSWSGNWGGQDGNRTDYVSLPSVLRTLLNADTSWPRLRFRRTNNTWTPAAPTNVAPVITAFTGEARAVDASSSITVFSQAEVTLRWAITGTPTPTFHVRESGSNTDLATTGISLVVSSKTTKTYVLTATNASGTVTKNIVMTVLPHPTYNHLTYTTLTATGSYTARSGHQAVGDEDEGIIFGGYDGTNRLNDAIRYVRSSNAITYTTLTATGSYTARSGHQAVGDEDEGIIFGGYDGTNRLNDAIRYVRSSNAITYTTLTATGSYTARNLFQAVGDEDEGIIFGGYDGTNRLNDAIRYVRSSNAITYTTLTATGSYTARNNFKAVGDKDEGIILFGLDDNGYRNDVIRYVRSGNNITYKTILTNMPEQRFSNLSGIDYAGTKYIGLIFGGYNNEGGGFYNHNNLGYVGRGYSTISGYLSTGSYSGRSGLQVRGDTSEGIIFGGYDGTNRLNDAIRYETSLTLTTAPVISSFTGEASGVSANTSITVNSGTAVTLRWGITGRPTPTFHVRVSGSNTNLATTGTSLSVSPTSTTTYVLTATNSAGSATKNVVVHTTQNVAPVISTFTGESTGVSAGSSISVSSGSSVTLRWTITGTPTPTFHVRVSGSSTNLATSGTSHSVSPTVTTTYVLTATNSAGSVTKNVVVNIATPNVAPSISVFTGESSGVSAATSITVNSGSSVTLRWTITGTPTPTFHVRVSGSSTNLATSGRSVSVTPSSTTTYTLTAMNAAGSITANVVVTVRARPTGTPNYVRITWVPYANAEFPKDTGWGNRGWGRRVNGRTFFGSLNGRLDSDILALTDSDLVVKRGARFNAVEYQGVIYDIENPLDWWLTWGGGDTDLIDYYTLPQELQTALRTTTENPWTRLRFRKTDNTWTPAETPIRGSGGQSGPSGQSEDIGGQAGPSGQGEDPNNPPPPSRQHSPGASTGRQEAQAQLTGMAASRIDEILFKDTNGRTKHYVYESNAYVSKDINIKEYSSSIGSSSVVLPNNLKAIYLENGVLTFESDLSTFFDTWTKFNYSQDYFFGNTIHHSPSYYIQLYDDRALQNRVTNFELLGDDELIFNISTNNGFLFLETFNIRGYRIDEFAVESNNSYILYKFNSENSIYEVKLTPEDKIIEKTLTFSSGEYSFQRDDDLDNIFKENNMIDLFIKDNTGNNLVFESTDAAASVPSVTESQFNVPLRYPGYDRIFYNSAAASSEVANGDYFNYKYNSSIQKILGMMIGEAEGCDFLAGYFGKVIYYQYVSQGNRSNYIGRTVCGLSSTSISNQESEARYINQIIIYTNTGPKRYFTNINTRKLYYSDLDIDYGVSGILNINKESNEQVSVRLDFDSRGSVENYGLNQDGGGLIDLVEFYNIHYTTPPRTRFATRQEYLDWVYSRVYSYYRTTKIDISLQKFMHWFNFSYTQTLPSPIPQSSSDLESGIKTKILSLISTTTFVMRMTFSDAVTMDFTFTLDADSIKLNYDDTERSPSTNHYNPYRTNISLTSVTRMGTFTPNSFEEKIGIGENLSIEERDIYVSISIYKTSVNLANRLALVDPKFGEIEQIYNSGNVDSEKFTFRKNDVDLLSSEVTGSIFMIGQNVRSDGDHLNTVIASANVTHNDQRFTYNVLFDNTGADSTVLSTDNQNRLLTVNKGTLLDNGLLPGNLVNHNKTGTFIYKNKEYEYILYSMIISRINFGADYEKSSITIKLIMDIIYVRNTKRYLYSLTNNPETSYEVDANNVISKDADGNRVKSVETGDDLILPTAFIIDGETYNIHSQGLDTLNIDTNALDYEMESRGLGPINRKFFHTTNTSVEIDFNIIMNGEVPLFSVESGTVVDGNSNLSSIEENPNGRIIINQFGYTHINQVRADLNSGVLLRKPLQEILTESGKLFLYEPTVNLPIYFARVYAYTFEVDSTGRTRPVSLINNPGRTNLDSSFPNRYFSIPPRSSGYYIYPRLNDLVKNRKAVTTLSLINMIFTLSNLTNGADIDSFFGMTLYRTPYELLLGKDKTLIEYEYAKDLKDRSGLEVYALPQEIIFIPQFSNVPVKTEGLINFRLNVDIPQPPDPDDYDWPDPPELPLEFLPLQLRGTPLINLRGSVSRFSSGTPYISFPERGSTYRFYSDPNDDEVIGEETYTYKEKKVRGAGGRDIQIVRYNEKYRHLLRPNTSDQDNRFEIASMLYNLEWQRVEDIYKQDVREYQYEIREFENELSDVLEGIRDMTIFGERLVIDVEEGLSGERIKTSNPAYICLHVLYEYHIRVRQFEKFSDMVDIASFNQWARYCETNGFEFNAIIDFETTVFSLIETIANVGRAMIILQRGRIKVTYARYQRVPKQFLSSFNIISFKSVRQKATLPDGLRGTFFDEESLYKQDEVVNYFVRTQDLAINVSEIDLFGITSRPQVFRYLDYLKKILTSDVETYQIKTGVENLVSEIGDLIALHYNEIDKNMFYSKFFKPKKDDRGTITGFVTDELVVPDLDLRKQYALKLIKNDGNILDFNIHSFTRESVQTIADNVNTRAEQPLRTHAGLPILKRDKRRLVLNLNPNQYLTAQAFIDSDIKDGNIMLIGEVNKITKYCVVKQVTVNKDLTCDVDLVEDNRDLYLDLVAGSGGGLGPGLSHILNHYRIQLRDQGDIRNV